jgi:hypothetical protein
MSRYDSTHLRAILDEDSATSWEPFEGEDEDVRVFSDQIVTARKDHICFHCNGPIHRSERHRARNELNRDEGKRMTFRWCPDCLNAYEMDEDEDGHWPFEQRSQLYSSQP